MTRVGSIDRPFDDDMVQRHAVTIEGWAFGTPDVPVVEVVVDVAGERLGSTQALYRRADVNEQLGIDPAVPTGFTIAPRIPERLRDTSTLRLDLAAVDARGDYFGLGSRSVRLSAYDYRGSGHGYVFADGFERMLVRDEVYGSGPPSPIADTRCVDLVARYLRPGCRVIDVGCGIGAYGHALTERGFRWSGCEIREDFVERVREDGLDGHVVVDGRLPFGDESFDAAIAIEVLEHARDGHQFLSEVRRVASEAYFSVPNFEAIPVTAQSYALPWHMLEADHLNFFTRAGLRSVLRNYYRYVEVLEYGPLPQLHALDGLPIFNHLFAVARA